MSIIEGRNAEILQSIIDGTPYENPNPYPSRIEQLLMELKEVIEEGGGTTVDQTYTPTSENAQSGTAVAEALGTIQPGTVDQTFDPASANAQSGVAVQQALDSKIYNVTFRQTPVATYISSQSFTNPYGNQGYIYTMAFHVRQNAPAGIPAGKYVGIHVIYGVIGFTIENDMLYAHCVVTDYGSTNVTVGNTTTLSSFMNIPCYKIG